MHKVFSYIYESDTGVNYKLIQSVIGKIEVRVNQKIPDRQADFIWMEENGGMFGIILNGRGSEKKIWFQGVSNNKTWKPNKDDIDFVRGLLMVIFQRETVEMDVRV